MKMCCYSEGKMKHAKNFQFLSKGTTFRKEKERKLYQFPETETLGGLQQSRVWDKVTVQSSPSNIITS